MKFITALVLTFCIERGPVYEKHGMVCSSKHYNYQLINTRFVESLTAIEAKTAEFNKYFTEFSNVQLKSFCIIQLVNRDPIYVQEDCPLLLKGN